MTGNKPLNMEKKRMITYVLCIVFLLPGLILVIIFLAPKLNEFLDTYLCTRYIPVISVSARSLDGKNKYSESELKFLIEKEFYLTFEVSVKIKGPYKRDKPVDFLVVPSGKLYFKPINCHGYESAYEIIASKHPRSEKFEFICEFKDMDGDIKYEIPTEGILHSKTIPLCFIKKITKKQKSIHKMSYNITISPIKEGVQ
jgi:hypothetical protein